MHFTQILLRLLHLIHAMLVECLCEWTMRTQVCGYGLPRERWESKKTQTKTHFEEKYCFTKCFRLAIVAWLPACLWKSQYSTMPDNHESLICQLVGRSMSIKKHHLSERTKKINFAICVHAQHHTCLSLRRHRPNKTATQALSILNFFEFSW